VLAFTVNIAMQPEGQEVTDQFKELLEHTLKPSECSVRLVLVPTAG
jgi:hypothetical protein